MRYLYIISLLTLITACTSKKQTEEKLHTLPENTVTLSAEQIKSAGIETGIIQKQLLNSELKVHGLVDVPPQNIVSISFPLGGYLKNTKLLPGMHVNKGEVIAIMEDQALIQLQQDYLIAQAKLQYAEKDFERQKMLNENKVNADKVYQRAQEEFTSQKALVKGYSEKLKLVGINPGKLNENTISRSVPLYSPINGFVSKVNINIGKYVNASDVLFELINPADIHAVLTVFEKDLAKVKPKQKVMVTFVDDPSTEYECEVLLVTKNVDDNRSALVHCHFEEEPQQLLPGMFLNARIKVSNAEVTAVPEAAVVRYGSDEFVLEDKGGNSFYLLPVQTGMKEGGMVEVAGKTGDLNGKTVIIKNAYAALSQMKNAGEED
ncbi:efflux RND transporter periplasmic adaptor subunit [Agriterribacter sp.]|uniref:efflux RND transporter periplasmic adaptor subunit n=1 Tax=Agriterribacter sp. TaxID=2821509 RepID=UPI002CBEA800|nr:efflux RND transporter periplasmic adaptor subunit [Agriterribacter sp.]HRO47176.1 efflux RND transporter periplasmic adaptor subunit [Agriterribacter sp.]HRQ18877.1 efflux RND transporter periplasmic adaptor subunit [Agriterribacter sp.]